MAEEKKSSNKTVIIILLIVIVLLLVGVGLFFVLNAKNKPAEGGAKLTSDGTIPYAVNVGVVKENENLADKLKEGTSNRIPLHFATGAYSKDGENFTCVLGNPQGAQYDMYFDMYSDSTLSEQIYISGLVAPGSQIESFKSSKTFPKGNTDVVLVITTVEDDHKTLHLQTMVALTLVVE